MTTTYTARRRNSKRLRQLQASSPAEAAYQLDDSGQPMQLIPSDYPAVWTFRRFDAPRTHGFTVRVWREDLA
jgi:hypothetical protein